MPEPPPKWGTTREVNCVLGCSHNCRYCFVKYHAVFKARSLREGQWRRPRIQRGEVKKNRRKSLATVVFPTRHDITPEVLDPCLRVLERLLAAGNRVVVESKPHLVCINQIVEKFGEFRSLLSFRFTIGALDPRILRYWEPGAPSFQERMDCLGNAYLHGFRTAVVSRPLLDPENLRDLIDRLGAFITDYHLVGPMEKVDPQALIQTPQDRRMVRRLMETTSEKALARLSRELGAISHVRWAPPAQPLQEGSE